MPSTPHDRWSRWRKYQASRRRVVRPRRSASRSIPTFAGVGPAITEPITLLEGRWRIVIDVTRNTQRTPSGSQDEHLLVMAVGESGYFEVLVNDTSAAERWTAQVLVTRDMSALPSHSPVFALPEGVVCFDIQTAAASAGWSISVAQF